MARKNTRKQIFTNVEVIDAAAKGKTVAKAPDGRVIFLPNAVPGDVVDVQTFKKRKAYYEGKATVFHKLSDKRTEWSKIGTNMHSKTVCDTYSLDERKSKTNEFELVDRPRKHRYIYIIGNKRDKKRLRKEMIYKEVEYPKGRVGYAN